MRYPRTHIRLGSMTAAERAKGRYMRAPDEHPTPPPPPADAPPAGDPPPAETPPAGDPPPAETPPVVSYDDAFAAALAEGNDATPAAPPAPPTAPAAPPAPPTAPDAPPAPPTAPTPPATPEAPPAPPTAAEIAAELAKGLLPPAPTPAPTPEPPEQPALYNDAETTAISEYQTNWPDVAKAEQLLRRAEYHDLLKFVFTEVSKVTSPLQQQIATMGNTLHTGELKELVPDYTPAVEADVTAWIDTQPTYLQGPYKQVMQTGTSDEVADLIGRYRAASGAAPATPTAPPAPAAPAAPAPPKAPAPAPKTELSEAAKQAAAALAPVSGDRSQAPSGDDPGDFKSAFDKYAADA